MKIYRLTQAKDYFFVPDAKAYIIDKWCDIIQVTEHINGVIEKYDLSSQLEQKFQQDFNMEMSWSDDYDTITEYVKDFMLDENIFCVVTSESEKMVYVRPTLGKMPSQKQIKALSDWAIEHKFNENVKIDKALAKSNKIYKLASQTFIAWITPNGQIIKGTLSKTHETLARENYQQLNLQKEVQEKGANPKDPYDPVNIYYKNLALSKNAVRFYIGVNRAYVEATMTALKNHMEKIIELTQNHPINVDIITESTSKLRTYQDLNTQEFMDLIYN